MNNVVLMGRLTRDPDIRYLQTGASRAVARFTIAVDKQLSREMKMEMESKNQPTADFIQIVAWGKLAENVGRFTGKGKRVIVSGRIQTGSYMDQEGKRVYTTDIVASNVEFLDWKDGGMASGQAAAPMGESSADPFDDDFSFSPDFDPTSDDGRIPF
ncbi:single-stranded DNA-binding protein [Peptoniphilaceae bacterium SGI.131]